MATTSLHDLTKTTKSPTASTGGIVEGELIPPSDTRRPARIGFWVLGIGFGGFLLWAGLAPIDEGVPTTGMVAIDTKRKTVQHLTGGIVHEINVREGDLVTLNQPLLVLDNAASNANRETVRQRYYVLRATEGRLVAEQANRPQMAIHPDLKSAAKDDPLLRETIAVQEGLLAARRSALRAETQSIEEAIHGQEALIASTEQILASRRDRNRSLKQERDGVQELVNEGFLPKARLWELDRQLSDVQGALAELNGSVQRAKSSILELRQRLAQRKQDYLKEVSQQLADIAAQVQAEQERLKAVSDDLSRMVIRSPAAGQVVGLDVQTVGGVVGPGQKIMDIVPHGEHLLLETMVLPHMIDRVHPGLTADVRFSSFANTPQLVVDGKVETISSDVMTDPRTGGTYYLARVSLTAEGKKLLGDRTLQPGMPVEVIVKTGERSFLTYLLRPLLKRIAVSLKEE